MEHIRTSRDRTFQFSLTENRHKAQMFALPFANTVADSLETNGYGAARVHLVDQSRAEVWLGGVVVRRFELVNA